MSDIAIRVNGLGKQYKIGGKQERYRTLRDSIMDGALSPFRRVKGVLRGEPYSASGLRETIWALKAVSFEIKHGEVVGIIGRNGAGKSTLLKILSQITEPTEGIVDLYGRVGSLLEVGTGFHPELTGRENVYLNGAILGMTRAEIDRKFDEIVDFSGVEKFIDTPVKHYSSGMQLRLGFAVAAHLEPEILLVDEVLAVGDAEFQKKCMGKMGDVSKEGRTVLFVSHNMASIETLTQRSLLFSDGVLTMEAKTDEVISEYLKIIPSQKIDQGEFIKGVKISANTKRETLQTGDSVDIEIVVDIGDYYFLDIEIGIGVNDIRGVRLFTIGTYYSKNEYFHIEKKSLIRCRIANLFLIPGTYPLKIALSDKNRGSLEVIEGAYALEIKPKDIYENGKIPAKHQGFLMIRSDWKIFNDEMILNE